MSNIISSGLKSTKTIQQFVNKPAGIKFRGVAGEKHVAYYPLRADEQDAMALAYDIHTILGFDGKERSFVCTKDIVNEIPQIGTDGKPVLDGNGNPVMIVDPKLDGTCPICERVEDARAIYEFQINEFKLRLREANPNISDAEVDAVVATKNGVRAHYAKHMMATRPSPKIYSVMLSAKLTADRKNPIELKEDGETPNIRLSVRAITGTTRAEGKLSYPEQLIKDLNDREAEQAEAVEDYTPKVIEHFGGCEVVYEFPRMDNYMQMMGDAYNKHKVKRLGTGYFDDPKRPKVKAEADRLLAEFDMGKMAEAFPELKDTNVQALRAQLNNAFASFDAWKQGGMIGTFSTGIADFAVPLIETGSAPASVAATVVVENAAPAGVPQIADKAKDIPMEGEDDAEPDDVDDDIDDLEDEDL